MRHKVAGFKLKREVDSRNALLRNLATSVILEERIITTVPKAKAVKPLVEKMITLAKADSLHSRRQAAAVLRTPNDNPRHSLWSVPSASIMTPPANICSAVALSTFSPAAWRFE